MTTTKEPKLLGRGVKRLPCVLSDVELLDFGQQIAAKKQELDNHVEQTKATAKTMVARKAELEARVNEIALALRTKKELRDVEYREEADFKTGLAVTIRNDTNATLHTRPLTPDERQDRLFGDGATEKTIPDRPGEVEPPPALTGEPTKKKGRRLKIQDAPAALSGDIDPEDGAA